MINNSIKELSTDENYYYIVSLPKISVASNTNIIVNMEYLTHIQLEDITRCNKLSILTNIFATNYICKIYNLVEELIGNNDSIIFYICKVNKFNLVDNTADIIIIKPNDNYFISTNKEFIFNILYILNERTMRDSEYKEFSSYSNYDVSYCYNIYRSRRRKEDSNKKEC